RPVADPAVRAVRAARRGFGLYPRTPPACRPAGAGRSAGRGPADQRHRARLRLPQRQRFQPRLPAPLRPQPARRPSSRPGAAQPAPAGPGRSPLRILAARTGPVGATLPVTRHRVHPAVHPAPTAILGAEDVRTALPRPAPSTSTPP